MIQTLIELSHPIIWMHVLRFALCSVHLYSFLVNLKIGLRTKSFGVVNIVEVVLHNVFEFFTPIRYTFGVMR